MSYQKCPVCDGAGLANHGTWATAQPPCRICNGAGIIDEVTGLPPAFRSFDFAGDASTSKLTGLRWNKDLGQIE